MSSLAIEDIQKIARLAKLTLPSAEIEKYSQQLTSILVLVEQMNQVNTDHINAVAHSLDFSQRLRPDIVTETNERTLFQKIAPAVEAGLYLVPKVIETD